MLQKTSLYRPRWPAATRREGEATRRAVGRLPRLLPLALDGSHAVGAASRRLRGGSTLPPASARRAETGLLPVRPRRCAASSRTRAPVLLSPLRLMCASVTCRHLSQSAGGATAPPTCLLALSGWRARRAYGAAGGSAAAQFRSGSERLGIGRAGGSRSPPILPSLIAAVAVYTTRTRVCVCV